MKSERAGKPRLARNEGRLLLRECEDSYRTLLRRLQTDGIMWKASIGLEEIL